MEIRKYFVGILFALFFLMGHCYSANSNAKALLLRVNSAITPATQDYIQRGIDQANKDKNVNLIILQLDTPGGLEKSMRNIVSDILASAIPIVVYVAPSGARAASAGTFILYASHIAAMAPGTNVGAATPIKMNITGGFDKDKKPDTAVEKKAVQDASAYIRSLAELRHRNAAWAEQAVNLGASISSSEALKIGVIDLIANDVPDLLAKINHRNLVIQGQSKVINTTDLTIEKFEPDWRSRFLAVITDPNVAYILIMIGIWGLFFEFVNPGFVLPGVVGAICLLLALYSFQLLPVNYAGLALIGLGIAFLIGEAFVTSFGVLGFGGIIALALGSIFLFGTHTPEFRIAWQLILGVCLATGAFFLFIVNIALKSRFRPVVSGREELIGQEGIIEVSYGVKRIRVLGELWQVRSNEPLAANEKVKVIGVDGLTLIVVKK